MILADARRVLDLYEQIKTLEAQAAEKAAISNMMISQKVIRIDG
jgi:hypothetical protein